MANKVFMLSFIWVGVLVAYIFMAAAMPAFTEIVATANTSMVASANMTNFPGTQEMVESFPLWCWFLPGLVGIVVSVIMLKKG